MYKYFFFIIPFSAQTIIKSHACQCLAFIKMYNTLVPGNFSKGVTKSRSGLFCKHFSKSFISVILSDFLIFYLVCSK